ncbi:Low affinity immunoglobulin gamma Fc region receptor II [Dissostichus eleginoides]|nr:Low affinity immunoglobulin gamma Fc region receptor II [Dissostichus eleginoides]
MGHTLLCLRGFFFLYLLYRGQAQDAVLTIEPNWTTFFTGESVTFKCDITGDKDSSWYYSIYRNDEEWLPYDKHESYELHPLTPGCSGAYQCFFDQKGSRKESNKIYLTVSDTPKAVLTVSPSWPSPGASVTLNCSVDHPSAGWSFYWYKAVPQRSYNSYSYELLPGSEKGTEQHLFIIDGQTHTAGYVCRAGREDRVYYSWPSEPKFVWSGDLNSAASLTVSPDSVQHFTETSVSLSCEGNSTEWRVRTKSDYPCSSWGEMTGSTCTITRRRVSGVFWCESETGQFSNAVNITKDDDEIILLSPVRPVAEGRSVTLSCKFKTENVYNVDFYKNDKLIQTDTRKELTISAVSKSDEGFYKCKQRDSARGRTSPESWFSVKSASGPGEASQFPILLIVGLLCGVLLIILLLLFLYLYRKSKDACCIRSQRTNQGPARDHMINQDETNQREYASVLQDNACLYETIKGPEEPANDESRDAIYSVLELKNISKKGGTNEPEDCVY